MNATRRTFLKSVAAGAASLAVAPRAGAATRPNMVVMLCDDLGYGDLGCYGHPQIQSPRLDGLAQEGMRLTDCYAAAPVCSPARAGLLTGRTPHRCGVFDWIPDGTAMHLGKDEVTVAALLRDTGYTTCHSGKWHCNGHFNQPTQPQPGDHGFDHWFSTQNNARPSHKDPENLVRNGEAVGPIRGYSSEVIADEAIDWLRKGRDTSKPFFLFVCFHAPHEPIATARKFMAPYGDAKEAIYFGNVSQMDHAAGRIVDELDALGLGEDTFVFFTSDNGPETLKRYRSATRSFGSPGSLRGMKLHLYEGGIRVPGIVRWPGCIERGSESGEPVCGVDVLPTLCAMAGAATPTDRAIDGTDMSTVFGGGEAGRTVPLYWRYDRALSRPLTVALRDGDWKLLSDEKLSRFALYNLRDDRVEAHDLSEKAPEQLARMQVLLRPLHEAIDAEGRAHPWAQS